MMALHSVHKLWHPIKAMTCTHHQVSLCIYPVVIQFDVAPDLWHALMACFNTMVGHSATYGKDLPPTEMCLWLSGKSQSKKQKEGDDNKPIGEATTMTIASNAGTL